MKKDLSRRANARPSADVLDEVLGVSLAALPVRMVPLTSLRVQEQFNPRVLFLSAEERELLFSREALADLTASMVERMQDGRPRGVQQPLLVRPAGKDAYWIVAGERRYHAAGYAGLSEVPVLIRDFSPEEAEAAAIIENAQRAEVDVISETFGAFRLLGHLTGMSQDELVSHLNLLRVGKTEDRFELERRLRILYGTGVSTWSQQRAKILNLTPDEQAAVRAGQLPVKAAVALVRLQRRPERAALLRELTALPERPSAQDVEARVDAVLLGEQNPYHARVQQFRRVLPRLGKLEGPAARRAQELMDELEKLAR